MPRLDKGLLTALVLGAILRIGALWTWIHRPCVRDECTYRDLASSLVRGEGMVGTKGWLWAPGYPSIIALHSRVTGRMNDVRYTQIAVALFTVVLLHRFTRAHFGPKAAAIAAIGFAVNPTYVFYASSLWSECFYTALLFGMVMAIGWARGEAPGAKASSDVPKFAWARALVVGSLLGACVLFRGVATYMLPIVGFTLLWGRFRSVGAWKSVAGMALGAAMLVAPYSRYATEKFGAFIVSDRTLGQMLWLGDNDYDPISFDYGNGPLRDEDMDAITATGRDHCPFERDPAKQDACETRLGVQWIKDHPGEFLRRVPLRLSQMLTPHSLLTRNLRTGRWHGLPDAVDEALVVAVVFCSFVVMIGGTIGICARGRGWFGVGAALVVCYHLAAIACLAGLSRYRVPLEPLWLVFAAGFLAGPRATFAILAADRPRRWAALGTCAVLLVLMLRFLPAGWHGWHAW